jgi:hypothetical protein
MIRAYIIGIFLVNLNSKYNKTAKILQKKFASVFTYSLVILSRNNFSVNYAYILTFHVKYNNFIPIGLVKLRDSNPL